MSRAVAVIDVAGFIADLKSHAIDHGFHVHDERHFVETYSLRQLWEVDLHPEEACNGPIDLHLSLEVDPRALLGFEDEVIKQDDPDADPPAGFNFPQSVAFDAAARLPYLMEGETLHAGVLVALAATVLATLVLGRSLFGFATRVVGASPRAARFAGFSEGRLTLAAFAISGGAAGLAGIAEVAGRIGQLISGRYRITAVLGEGGMGTVYLAEHTHMKKRFAMKLLHAEMANDEEVLARFRREAEAAVFSETKGEPP